MGVGAAEHRGAPPVACAGDVPLRGTRAQEPKPGASTLRADAGEYGAGKGAVQGPPMDPSNGPIAGWVGGVT